MANILYFYLWCFWVDIDIFGKSVYLLYNTRNFTLISDYYGGSKKTFHPVEFGRELTYGDLEILLS